MNKLEVLNITQRQIVFSAKMLQRLGGGIGFFGFADLANFSPLFSFLTLKNCGFSVLRLVRFRRLSLI